MLLSFSLFYTSQINEERKLAQLQAQRAEEATSILIDLFEANQPSGISGKSSSINEFLELGIRKTEQLQNNPELKSNIYSVIGQTYRKTGDLDQAGNLLNNAWLINKNIYGVKHTKTLAVVDQ